MASASGGSNSRPPANDGNRTPLIPLEYCDAPNQRFYAVSLFALQQSYKLFQFAESYLPSPSPASVSRPWLLFKWAILDAFTIILLLPLLRIPRFSWNGSARTLLVLTLCLSNWILVGNWRTSGLLGLAGVVIPSNIKGYFHSDLAILEHKVRLGKLVDPATHILGSFTIHILPHSTARFLHFENQLQTPCVAVQGLESGLYSHPALNTQRQIAIPVLLNNTQPKYLQYSIAALGGSIDEEGNDGRAYYNLSAKDLTLISTGAYRSLLNIRGRDPLLALTNSDANDEGFDDDISEERDFAPSSGTLAQRLIGYDGTQDTDALSAKIGHSTNQMRELAHSLRHFNLQPTQSIWAFYADKPGIIRLERVIDKSDNDVRVPNPRVDNIATRDAASSNSPANKIVIVPCPQAAFVTDAHRGKRSDSENDITACQADTTSQEAAVGQLPTTHSFTVEIYGYPPLRLQYHRLVGPSATASSRHNAQRESATIDGIAPEGALLMSQPHDAKAKISLNKRTPGNGDSLEQKQIALVPLNQQSLSNIHAPEKVHASIEVSSSLAGDHSYQLDKITDATGNSFDFSSLHEQYETAEARTQKRKASVRSMLQDASVRHARIIPRSQISFVGCGTSSGAGSGQPVKLLEGGKANLHLRISTQNGGPGGQNSAGSDSPYTVSVSHEKDSDPLSETSTPTQEQKTFNLKLTRASESISINKPGRYRISGFRGDRCDGQVLEPSECIVYTPPLPTVDLSLDPITDACAGEVGLRAMFSLSGEPPYRVHYTVLNGANGKPQKRTKTIKLSRDELELRPDQTGEFVYEFVSLDDGNYQGIPIGRSIRQSVHPLASARFLRAGTEQKVWSCEGERVSVPIELSGISPWTVHYKIVGQKNVHTVEGVQDAKTNLDVAIPPKIAKHGGSFTLSLVRIQDGRGCSQEVTVDDLVVSVHRTKPTAAFVASSSVTVKQGTAVSLPLRLTGEGPWKLTYQQPNSDKPRTLTVRDSNGNMLVDQAGHYELLSVSDAHCPGVIGSAKTYDISWITRPTVSLIEHSGKLAKNGSYIRQPVCEGVDDSATAIFAGQAPFLLTYDLIESGPDGQRHSSQDIRSSQKEAQFELSTASPSHRLYEITGLSDATYDQLSKQGLTAPPQGKKGVLRLEQTVLARPTATFANQDKPFIYCVKDSLQAAHSVRPVLKLAGLPPFVVELEVTPDGSHMSQRYSKVSVPTRQWTLSLPHTFAEPGPVTVYIRKIVDATGCERIIPKGSQGTTARLEVAEIASIAPIQLQTDHCVGESIDFVLQGASPWTVVYTFNGKKQTVASKDSRFSRVAESPGQFSISSVAHHQDSCKSVVTDIEKTVHPLPTAKVKSGVAYIENIREGDQAEIVFEFQGTPPFTFTYTKSAPTDRKSRKPAPILETHTITGVDTHRYSIYSQSEGTWAITSVSDKYCSYPPLAKADRRMLKAA